MDEGVDAAGTPEREVRGAARVVVGVCITLAVVTIGLGSLGSIVLGRMHPSDPASVVAGASTDGFSVWARTDDGLPVRWDPCSPIELVFAPAGAPAEARADLDDAVETLRQATGLDLVVTGTTDERPSGSRLPYQPETYGERWAPILVAWASPGADGLPLRQTDRGVAIPIAVGPAGDRTYVSGQVVFNAGRSDLVPGREDRARSWGATILHELVHVLGLGHVGDPNELMYVYPGAGPVRLGPGDRAGLRAVGTEGGCRQVPIPRAVEVAGLPDV